MRPRSARRPRAAVTGVGVLSSLGDTPGALGDALAAGHRGLAPLDAFDPAGWPLGTAGEVRGFQPERYLPEGNLRSLDRNGRLATAAAASALADAGLAAGEDREIGCVLGTMFGSLRTIAGFDRRALTAGPRYARPMDFANSVINAPAGQAAIWLGLKGPGVTVSGGTASGLQALVRGAEMIATGQAATTLAGGADELCEESFLGFCRAGLAAGSAAGEPPCAISLDRRRNGFVPGEGAALLALEEADAAAARGGRIRAMISGHGTAFDTSLGTDEAVGRAAVERAVRQALRTAGRRAEQIDAVGLSADGSVLGDRVEARGVAAVLEGLPACAPLASLGQCLGASGALQAAAMLEAMARSRCPGVAGLGQPEEDLGLSIEAHCRRLDIRRALLTSYGLDGQAVALILERPDDPTPPPEDSHGH